MNEKVSIIMPAFNAEAYIEEAINSVLAQEHRHWELIVVNDGSTDATEEVVRRFDDERILLVHQENRGIGGARNTGLEHVSGSYLVMLDADDLLPPKSLSSRMQVFRQQPELSFVDGAVRMMDRELSTVLSEYSPSFKGEPLRELVHLTGRCFLGITWMIRIQPDMLLRFDENTTHGEDLLFYIGLAKGRQYGFTREQVLIYRRHRASTMSDLDGLMRGYEYLGRWMGLHPEIVPAHDLAVFKQRSSRIAARSYWKAGKYLKALLFLAGIRRPKFHAEPEAREFTI